MTDENELEMVQKISDTIKSTFVDGEFDEGRVITYLIMLTNDVYSRGYDEGFEDGYTEADQEAWWLEDEGEESLH